MIKFTKITIMSLFIITIIAIIMFAIKIMIKWDTTFPKFVMIDYLYKTKDAVFIVMPIYVGLAKVDNFLIVIVFMIFYLQYFERTFWWDDLIIDD